VNCCTGTPHSRTSSEIPAVNGNMYTVERHDECVANQAQNGVQAAARHSEQSAVNTAENVSALCSLRELDVTAARADDCGAKQVVKSLLRAMLAKPRPNDVSSLIALTTKNECDSGSEDAMEQPMGADGMDDDSQSANDTVGRDDVTTVKSETELVPTRHHWPLSSSALTSSDKASHCPYCLKVFRYRSSYRRHVKIHEGIFSHECSVCLRKFTRKEHYVRHKCDRRPNKPYNVTHEAFRQMSPSQKAAARHVVQAALSTGALVHSGLGILDGSPASDHSEVPLELTCQSSGKQLDVPKLLFTGGSVSSMSLDCSTFTVTSMSTSTGPHSLDNIAGGGALRGSDASVLSSENIGGSGLRALDTSVLSSESIGAGGLRGLDSSVLPHCESWHGAQSSESIGVGGLRALDASVLSSESIGVGGLRALDASVLPHSESRRKSSTPRKVVTAASDVSGTIESDRCRLNFPGSLNNLNSVPLSVID